MSHASLSAAILLALGISTAAAQSASPIDIAVLLHGDIPAQGNAALQTLHGMQQQALEPQLLELPAAPAVHLGEHAPREAPTAAPDQANS